MPPRHNLSESKALLSNVATAQQGQANPATLSVSQKPHLSLVPVIPYILAFCVRQTLARCLRVSARVMDMAGTILYRHITLSGEPHRGSTRYKSHMEAVLSGANGKMLNSDKTKVAVTRNFKIPLLAKVHAVTVTSHFKAHCNPHSAKIAKFLPNLIALRLCPPRLQDPKKAMYLCSNEDGCKLVKRLDPGHLIYRNIGINGTAMPHFLDYHPPNLKVVTYVLPADRRFFDPHDDIGNIVRDLRNNHEKVKHVRIVFSGDEVSIYAIPDLGPVTFDEDFDCQEDDYDEDDEDEVLFDLFEYTFTSSDTRYEFCGGEVLGKGDYGRRAVNRIQDIADRLVAKFKKANADYDENNIKVLTRAQWKGTEESKWEMCEEELGEMVRSDAQSETTF